MCDKNCYFIKLEQILRHIYCRHIIICKKKILTHSTYINNHFLLNNLIKRIIYIIKRRYNIVINPIYNKNNLNDMEYFSNEENYVDILIVHASELTNLINFISHNELLQDEILNSECSKIRLYVSVLYNILQNKP